MFLIAGGITFIEHTHLIKNASTQFQILLITLQPKCSGRKAGGATDVLNNYTAFRNGFGITGSLNMQMYQLFFWAIKTKHTSNKARHLESLK